MAAVYRFARVIAPDNVNPQRSKALTAKYPGTSNTVTLYTDPTLTAVLSSAGAFSTDATGFAEFCTNGVPAIDVYSGSTLLQANIPVGAYYNIDAPLTSSATLLPAFADPVNAAYAGGATTAANLPRTLAASDLAALTTQVMTSTAIYLPAGFTVTNLTFVSGATAAGTPTNWWYALYSTAATPALLSQTADQLTAAWAANTAVTLALTTPYVIPAAGVYYAAVAVKATTVPTLAGATSRVPVVSGALSTDKTLAVTSGSALTGTAPATIATPTNVATIPYVVAN